MVRDSSGRDVSLALIKGLRNGGFPNLEELDGWWGFVGRRSGGASGDGKRRGAMRTDAQEARDIEAFPSIC
jgi:hypothetical protein